MNGSLDSVVWMPGHFQLSPLSGMYTLTYIPHILADISLHTDMHYLLIETHRE